mgnify:CR=1 FL=1
MAELRVKSTGTLKLFESDNTSSVTIASPASLGADRTVTLPDASVTLASGTMLATDGDGSGLSGVGKILQVQHDIHTGTASTTSTSYQDIPLEITITPSSTSNKILCFANLASIATSGSGTSAISVRIVRDTTEIATTTNFGFGQTTSTNYFTLGLHNEDSPSSTSALTYKVQFKNREANTVTINGYSGDATTLTVMEVAG